MRIRELGRADVAVFQAFRLHALLECPSAFASSYEEADAVVAERLAGRPDRCILGAFEASRLVGMVGVQQEALRKLAHKAFIWGRLRRSDSATARSRARACC